MDWWGIACGIVLLVIAYMLGRFSILCRLHNGYFIEHEDPLEASVVAKAMNSPSGTVVKGTRDKNGNEEIEECLLPEGEEKSYPEDDSFEQSLVQSFFIDSGQLDHLEKHECFTLGAEFMKAFMQAEQDAGFMMPIRTDNAHRVGVMLRANNRKFRIQTYEKDDWRFLEVAAKGEDFQE